MEVFEARIDDKFFIIRVHEDMHSEIHALAKAHGLTVSGMVRALLRGRTLQEILTPAQS